MTVCDKSSTMRLAPSTAASTQSGELLATVRFSTGNTTASERAVVIPLALLSGSDETWISSLPVRRGVHDGVSFAADGRVLFGFVENGESDIELATQQSYGAMIGATRAAGYPHLVRIWNHVRDINVEDGDRERYKRFCAGRHRALTEAGWTKRDFPAASAVGAREGNLSIYFLASRIAGTHVENPRQVSAYDYPRQYGRHSPSFARATILDDTVFVSGTSSVVGYATRHAGDIAAQTDETIANLIKILGACSATPEDVAYLKIYVRREGDESVAVPRLVAVFPDADVNVLASDICRRELLVEAEVVAIRRRPQ